MAVFAADDLVGPFAGYVEAQAAGAGEADAGVFIACIGGFLEGRFHRKASCYRHLCHQHHLPNWLPGDISFLSAGILRDVLGAKMLP